MSLPHETYEIDCFGDILFVLVSGDSQGGYEEREEDLSDSDTLFDDASSLDSSITDGILARASEPERDIDHHIPRRAVRFRVTSYSLRRSSPVFEQLLNQYVGYPGAAYQLHYPIRIPIWDDDPFIIDLVLRVIHADDPFQLPDQDISQLFPNTKCLLNHINLDTLARIATVAHKYQLQSTLDSCLLKWVDDIWKNMDGASVSEAMDWIWVTWTFELTDHFSTATKYVARNSIKHLEIEDEIKYPYLHQVFRAIDRIRIDALTELYCLFTAQLRATFQSSADGLDRTDSHDDADTRNAMTAQESCRIGLLLLHGHRLKFWPQHEPDFQGISYTEAVKIIRYMISPRDCWMVTAEGSVSVGISSSCREQFLDLFDCLGDRDWELTIEDFKTRS